MSWQADIYQAATTDQGVSALVGSRVYWEVADGDTVAPYVVLQCVSGSGETCHDGSRDVSFPLLQVTAWAAKKLDAVNLMTEIRNALEGKNLPGNSNVSLGYSGEDSGYEQQTKLFSESIDFRVSTNTNN